MHRIPAIVDVLDQVEHGDAVTNRREQTCSVGREQQVSSAVDGPKQIRKLARVSRIASVHAHRRSHLEVCLHREDALCCKCRRRIRISNFFDMLARANLAGQGGAHLHLLARFPRPGTVPAEWEPCRKGTQIVRQHQHHAPRPRIPSYTNHRCVTGS
jgi:hypothetical protein